MEERSAYAELRSDTVEAACSLLPGDGEVRRERRVPVQRRGGVPQRWREVLGWPAMCFHCHSPLRPAQHTCLAHSSQPCPPRPAPPRPQGHVEEEVWEVEAQPLYVAVVDAACSPEFLEVVRSALLAALEALPPAAFFGLITVAEEVGWGCREGAGTGWLECPRSMGWW